MEILPNLEIIDLALWIKSEKTILFSDFHIGYEGELEETGILIPKFQLEDILKRLIAIFEKVKPTKIIINGDLKHHYPKILKQEWRNVLKLVDFLKRNCQELIIVRGNHDLFLGPIASKGRVKIVDDYIIKDIFICHGNTNKKNEEHLALAGKKIKTLIIAHEHPAIVLKHQGKSEKYKCFLKGKFQKKNLLVMPSFNPLSGGTDITGSRRFSPYLPDISNFEVFAIGEKVYNFGKVKNLSTL